MNEPNSNDPEHRVLPFPQHGRGSSGPVKPRSPGPESKTGRNDDDAADDRHRTITNVAGLAFVVLLIAAGIWLANTMATMRKNEDCVLSGRRNCAPIEAPSTRW